MVSNITKKHIGNLRVNIKIDIYKHFVISYHGHGDFSNTLYILLMPLYDMAFFQAFPYFCKGSVPTAREVFRNYRPIYNSGGICTPGLGWKLSPSLAHTAPENKASDK